MTLKAVAIVLGIVGVYLDIFHGNFMPLNHAALGLTNNHTIHGAVGVALLGAAAWLWMRATKATSAAA